MKKVLWYSGIIAACIALVWFMAAYAASNRFEWFESSGVTYQLSDFWLHQRIQARWVDTLAFGGLVTGIESAILIAASQIMEVYDLIKLMKVETR